MITLLLLRSHVALWSQWDQGQLTSWYEEAVNGLAQNGVSSQRTGCPWITEKDHAVYLILDSPHEEIDSVYLPARQFWLTSALDRRALLRRLRRRAPTVQIEWYRSSSKAARVLTCHVGLSEQLAAWLVSIQEGHVTIVSTESICSVLASQSAASVAPTLLIFATETEQRHVLCDNRSASFTRVIQVADDHSVIAAIRETVQHLNRDGLATPASMMSIGLSSNLVSRLEQQSWVETVIDVSVTCPSLGDRDSESFSQAPLAMCWVMHMAAQNYNTRYQWLCKQRSNPVWMVKQKRNCRLLQLRVVCALSALVASYSVSLAGVQAMHRFDAHSRQVKEQQRLQQSINHYQSAASQITSAPISVARSLQQANQLSAANVIDPNAMARIVALAYTEFPSIVLNTLQWRMRDDSEHSDLAYAKPYSHFVRDKLPNNYSAPARVDVQLGGVIRDGGAVRQSQSKFDAFVAYLEAMPLVERVTIEQSPVDAALRNSNLLRNDVLPGNVVSDYRLELRLREK